MHFAGLRFFNSLSGWARTETTLQLRRFAILIPMGVLLFKMSACDRIGSHRKPDKAWFTADLTNYAKVDWNPTNAIPLSPDAAVRAALTHLEQAYGTNFVWRVSSIGLEKDDWSPWMYKVECKSGQDRDLKWEHVKVLLSGEVWKQRKVE